MWGKKTSGKQHSPVHTYSRRHFLSGTAFLMRWNRKYINHSIYYPILITALLIIYFKSETSNIFKVPKLVASNQRYERRNGKALVNNDQSMLSEFGWTAQHSTLPHSAIWYIHWHAQMYTCMEAGNCSTYPNILVWRCLHGKSKTCAGIGDRLRGIQFSLLFSIITQRFFLIDWPNSPHNFSEAVIPALINWKVPNGLNHENWQSLAHYKWPTLQWVVTCSSASHCSNVSHPASMASNLSTDDLNLTSADDLNSLNHFQNLTIFANSTFNSVSMLTKMEYLMVPFQDLDPNKIGLTKLLRTLLQIIIQPSPIVTARLKELKMFGVKKAPYLSAHIRTGVDFGERYHHRFKSLPNDSFIAQQLLECIVNICQGKNVPIFLASDSLSLKQKVLELGRRRQMLINTEFLPAIHVARLHHKISDKLRWDAFINIYVEFFGIAGANYIVGNMSGFSRMAYLAGNASEHIQFNPSSRVQPKCRRQRKDLNM